MVPPQTARATPQTAGTTARQRARGAQWHFVRAGDRLPVGRLATRPQRLASNVQSAVAGVSAAARVAEDGRGADEGSGAPGAAQSQECLS